MEFSRRSLLGGVVGGVVATSGCLTLGNGCVSEPPSEEQMVAGDLQLHRVALHGTQYKIEVLRNDEQTELAIRLANELEDEGASITTSDAWSGRSGGDRWDMWVYGEFTEEEINAYVAEYDLDARVTTRSGAPSGSRILSDSPTDTPWRFLSRGGEFGRRAEVWKQLPELLHPFTLYNVGSNANCMAFYQDPDFHIGLYVQQLLEQRGHVNLLADGISPTESEYNTPVLRPGQIVEPNRSTTGDVYHDPSEIHLSELSVGDSDGIQDWESHWQPTWERSDPTVRMSGDFFRVGLPELVEWYQEHFNTIPTTITLRVDQQPIASERLESLVETPAEPDTYGSTGDHHPTPFPRISPEMAALLTVYLAAPYEMDLGSQLTIGE